MTKQLKPCKYCLHEIKKEPIIDEHQGKYSVLCPHCLSWRGEWMPSIEEAIKAWNEEMGGES